MQIYQNKIQFNNFFDLYLFELVRESITCHVLRVISDWLWPAKVMANDYTYICTITTQSKGKISVQLCSA